MANAQKGAYADLTDLAPKYAKEAYDQLDEAYIKGNTIDGKLYAFPVNGNVYAQQVLTFNKQYLDKYDIDISNINSYADAEDALKNSMRRNRILPASQLVKPSTFQETMTMSWGKTIHLRSNLTETLQKSSTHMKMTNKWQT